MFIFNNLYLILVEKKIVLQDYNPVSINETISRPTTNISGRPVPRIMRTVYSYNTNVKRVDWNDPCLSFEKLLDENLPIPPTFFVIPK